MKSIFILILILFIVKIGAQAQSLSGSVIDSATHQPIPGAVVYFPELKLGTTTDVQGNYKIITLPRGTYEMEVRIVGYATLTKQVTINGNATCMCSMCTSACNANEVIITALGNVTNIQRSPTPVSLVSHDMLLENTYNTAIEAIATQPGINMTSEGPGTTKPQINGLGFNRVLTLMDGERQEDFQWGDDHGLLIDPYAVYDAEIIRGPASLQYGANAVAGVISFKSQPFAEEGTVQGSVLTEYHTNSGYVGTSENVGGNNKGFVWDLRLSSEQAHDYQNPKDGYVWGSAWQQENGRLTLGLNKAWGFSRLTMSVLHRRIQVPDGNRDSTGRFLFDHPQYGQLYPNRSNFLAYDPSISGDKVLDHITLWWQNSIKIGQGRLGVDIGYTQSIHHDIDTGQVGSSNFNVHDIPYSVKYQLVGNNSGLKLTTGVNGTYEFMNNFTEVPAPYVSDFQLPNYTNTQVGGYAIVQKDFKNLTIVGGVRYDRIKFQWDAMYLKYPGTPSQQVISNYNPNDTTEITQFKSFNNTYAGTSGSLGLSYQLPGNNYMKLNVAKSYRAPAINELTSTGLNIGSNAVQQGNLNLKAEEGYQADLAYGNNGREVSFEADGFFNYITNFIFPVRLVNKAGGDSIQGGFPVYEFLSNKAIITGVSGYFNIHPSNTKWLEINNGFTYIYSYLPNSNDSTKHIPYMPAPHLTTEVKIKLADRPHSILSNTIFVIGQAKYWAQYDIYSALYTEIPSPAYTLYNVGFGTGFVNPKTGRKICSLFINCTNLTNLSYADHLNLAQYFLSYNGNNVTVSHQGQGIYNMGRNFSFKLIFPIGGHNTNSADMSGLHNH